jgi:hypothetical protein
MDDFQVIPGFPNYIIYRDGTVVNVDTERQMVLSPTLQGDLTVGLMRREFNPDTGKEEGTQYRRSVKVLVAEAFVDGWSEYFNTPIQLDCNKYNLNAWNIRWRPRWFAWKYSRQFSNTQPSWFYGGPVFDIATHTQYATILEAAVANGSLCEDIRNSLLHDTRVFPTGEIYTYK